MAVMIRLLIRHRTASQAVTTACTASPTVMAVMIRLLIRHRTASQAATMARTASLHRLTVNHWSPVVPIVVASTVMIRIHTAVSQATFPSIHIPLYSGSRLTVLESCLLLLQFLLRSVLIACHWIDYRV